MNQRNARLTWFGHAPRTVGGAALAPHQSPAANSPRWKARQHQAYYDFGIDAGAAIVGTVKIGHFSAKPPKVETLIYLHQHRVIGDQILQRPGDEKFQLPVLFPTQNRSLSSIDMQSESEAWGFFNSPNRTDV